MNAVLRILLLLIVASLGSKVCAQAVANLDPSLSTVENRRAMAQDFAKSFGELDRQVPQLSPSQRAWLKVEYDDEIASAGNRYTKRAITAMDSLEYQLHVVKPRTAEILEILSRITEASRKSKSVEVALWALLIHHLMDYQYWQAVASLVERKAIQEKIGNVQSYYFQSYTLQAQNLLSRIVIPHLQERLP